MGHDQRFKEFLQVFLQDFLRLFFPDVEKRLDFRNVELLDKELFVDFPQGSSRSADVVAKLHTHDGEPELVLIHIEVQARPEQGFGARMFEYYSLLWSRYRLPIFPVAVFLEGGTQGLGMGEYYVRLFGRELVRFRYESVWLARLDATEYVKKDSPVGAALGALMDRSTASDVVTLRASMLRGVVESELDDARQLLLANLVETYFVLSAEAGERYRRLISRREYRKVQDVQETWMDKLLRQGKEEGFQEGREEGREAGLLDGKRETLLHLMERKFGPLPDAIRERIRIVDSRADLDRYLERILTAESLSEMKIS